MRFLAAILALAIATTTFAEDKPKPIHALMVCGGCCHDYEKQQWILSEGISKRANVEWTIVCEGTDREHKVSIYENPNWAKGYDVVLHNECFGFVSDNDFVERITKPHFDGLPAVVIHCSTHSYRQATTEEWHKFIGQTSHSHETKRDIDVKNLQPDNPVMKGFPATWHDAQDELYKNEKLWPNFVPLAQAYGVDTKQDHACIWLNTYGKGKVFGTTLGHTDETESSDVYLDLVTRGLLWACDKLNADGTPKPGYGPGGK